MKKLFISGILLLFIGIVIYANNQFGLLSLAGLNSEGLTVKEVTGDLTSAVAFTSVKIDHSAWSQLLQKHVDTDGFVDYKGFLADKKKLEVYLSMLSNHEPSDTWSIQEQLAYYINAYNAYTVFLILENFPVKSIKDINGPWTKDIVKIGDKIISLGTLEHSILRKMNEPRIHFAINCASGSCPKLLNEAFTASRLDAQLDKVTKEFINSQNNTITKEKVELSKIFKWYKGDFMRGDLITYINQYTDVKIEPKARISYQEYDWNLNGSW